MNARRTYAAFTLIELLTVIAIIGILAALLGPVVSQFRKGDATLAATRQMLDDVARARQLAISQRTTVYMVFVPTNFWADSAYTVRGANPFTYDDLVAITNLWEKQMVGYNFVTLRSLADQPGQSYPRYLSTWKTLPDSSFIAIQKFTASRTLPHLIATNLPSATPLGFDVHGFQTTTNIPFPRAETRASAVPNRPYVALPYIAFDYTGSLVSDLDEEIIPLAQGSALPARDPETKQPLQGNPDVQETPIGNSTNSYNLIRIDSLTGRARLERPEVR